jgi:hypothetical protein
LQFGQTTLMFSFFGEKIDFKKSKRPIKQYNENKK